MNYYSVNDVHLQALETRLNDIMPKLPQAELQQLLYQCAFAAGQRKAKCALRCWQGASAVLTVLLLGVTIPLARERSSLPQLPAEQLVENRHIEPREADKGIPLIAARGAIAVSLDAWQTRPSAVASFDDELARFAQTDPRLRSLAVGALTRQILEQ